MSKKFDTDAILSSVHIEEVIGNYIEIKKNGSEFNALCPFHEENTPSFTISPKKEFYHCFGCGAGGDAINFVMEYTNCTFPEACKSLGAEETLEGEPVRERVRRETVDCYAGIKYVPTKEVLAVGAPVNLYNPKRDSTWYSAKPEAVYPYRDASGKIHSYVLRFTMGDGKKLTPQVRHTDKGWCMIPMEDPRMVYGLRRSDR